MRRLEGKSALVLGAGTPGNIGQAIARRFADEGCKVVVAGVNAQGITRFAAEIGAIGLTCDIRSEIQLKALVEQCVQAHGKLDIAVNATGLNQVKPFLDVSREELDAVVGVQFVGSFLFLQAVLREIADGGSIIQISSLSATVMLPDHAAYMATKSGADLLVRALAADFGHRGIRINSIAPGPTQGTPMSSHILADPAKREAIARTTPLGRLCTPDDIANAATWLADPATFVTGEVLQVNGGRALNRLR